MHPSVAKFLKLAATCGFVFVLSAAAGAVHAAAFKVVYAFAGKPDGLEPRGNLIEDSAGNLYGTTIIGGKRGCGQQVGCGTVFEITAGGQESVLHTFCSKPQCADGAYPYAGLVADSAGNLYGTVDAGGDKSCDSGFGCGAVFKLAPDGTETIVHAFHWGKDGAFPQASLVFDANGNLYGTTVYGGVTSKMCDQSWGCGTVFKIAPDGTETILHRFDGAYTGTGDGAYPEARLWLDAAGDIFGTTTQGGTTCNNGGCGVLFEITAAGKEKVLYTFCSHASCRDGSQPFNGVIEDSAGNLYGATTYGGNPLCPEGCGTLFEFTAGGSYQVMYTFQDVTNGAYPDGDLTTDATGNIYGTTFDGGSNHCGGGGCGEVFEYAPGGPLTVLHAFESRAEGRLPRGGVLLDSAGNIFGTTSAGGAICELHILVGCGTVFKLTP